MSSEYVLNDTEIELIRRLSDCFEEKVTRLSIHRDHLCSDDKNILENLSGYHDDFMKRVTSTLRSHGWRYRDDTY